MIFRKLIFTLLAPPLLAQAPPGWNARPWLGAEYPTDTTWYGVGTWAADSHGPSATFVDSLGMGNALRGGGIHGEFGLKKGNWDLAIEGLGIRDSQGQAYLSIYRSHITRKSLSGWTFGFEQEPLVWGYGLNGGYLLSEAARPFPKFRVETPMVPLRFFRIPLGTWGAQIFVGRLERDRVLGDSVQDPAWRRTAILRQGDPQTPMFNGYRLQARFGPSLEFYANYTNLWSGTLNGVGRTTGYNLGDYLTAMFGLKDALAEANVDPHDPNPPSTPYKNNARSASNADIGARLRVRPFERFLGAEQFHAYITRGTKNVYWAPALLYHKPLYCLGKDFESDNRDLLNGRFVNFWNKTDRYSVPNAATPPNDIMGVLIQWPKLRLGLEYANTITTTRHDARPFMHYEYITGFYTYGDPLGNAIAGETKTLTLRLESELSSRISCETLVHVGFQPFRDHMEDWLLAHPGAVPVDDHFQGLQQTWKFQLKESTRLELGASWRHHGAVESVQGQSKNGFRWFADLAYRWPAAPKR